MRLLTLQRVPPMTTQSSVLRRGLWLFALAVLCLLTSPVVFAQGTTAFTYQGQLRDGGTNANGNYGLTFKLRDAATAGNQVGPTLNFASQFITNGQFNASLDFGSVFDGSARWLEITVAGNVLSPRTLLAPTPYALHAAKAGSVSDPSFIGTTGNTPLEFYVDGLRALRLEPHDNSPNFIGGYSGNTVSNGYSGSVIVGGGVALDDEDGQPALNIIGASYAFIGGGARNKVTKIGGVIVGGFANLVSDDSSAIVGGGGNTVSGDASFIGGGSHNLVSGDSAVITGGNGNQVIEQGGFIGGGESNIVSGFYASIGGGKSNQVSSHFTTIAGGQNNTASGSGSTVSGGQINSAGGNYAVVGGGQGNTASGVRSVIAGGQGNTASASGGFLGGGDDNVVSGEGAVVPGGLDNVASGAYSFAAGYHARATHGGSFVWASGNGTTFNSALDNEFAARAIQFRFYVSDLSSLKIVPGGTTVTGSFQLNGGMNATGGATFGANVNAPSFNGSSDRNAKQDFAEVNGREVLAKVVAMPIQMWNYKQDAATRHIGPMAQDFHAAFGVGIDEKHIATVDADGVALAAIQGLNEVVKEKDAEIASLKQRLENLEKAVSTLVQQQKETAQ